GALEHRWNAAGAGGTAGRRTGAGPRDRLLPGPRIYLTGGTPAGRNLMNRQDQQAIDELFQRLYQTTEQGGPRDPEAEARIQRHFQKGPPGLLYHMAQTLVAQQYALQQARAELADCRQQGGGASAGVGRPGPQRAGRGGSGGGYGGYQQPPQNQQGYQQQAPAGSG